MTLDGQQGGVLHMKEEFYRDKLKVNVYRNRHEMGEDAANAIIHNMKELLVSEEEIRIIFAAAPSQLDVLKELVKRKEEIPWNRVTAFHMDEYIGLESGAKQLFSSFLYENLWQAVQPGQVYTLNPKAVRLEEEIERYSQLLCEEKIHMVILGIGENGHIAFNDPPVANFKDKSLVKIVKLDDICRNQQVNDGCFPSIEQVPTHALTLTIPALIKGEYLHCIVPTKNKHEAVVKTLSGTISTECPSTILRLQSHCTLYLDRDAYLG